MKLALACGRADVDRFLSEIPSQGLSEWMAYERKEGPIDIRFRLDHAAAGTQALLANVHRDTKKRKRAFGVKDFMPRWGQIRKSPEQMMEIMRRAFGGR